MTGVRSHLFTADNSGWLGRTASLITAVVVTLFLLTVSHYHFLWFHVLVEFFAITVGFALYIIAYNSFVFNRNAFLLFLAQGFFWVACIDLLHTLYYRGMHLAPADDPNYATQLWICARYLEAFTLLIAPRYLSVRLPSRTSFLVFSVVALGACSAVVTGYFPDAFIQGKGLTPFKIISEYLIIGLLLVAGWRIQQQRQALDPGLRKIMFGVIGLTIVSEFVFTLYVSVYGLSNLVGHFAKLWAFGLLLLAISRWMLAQPFRLLARDAGSYESMPMPVLLLDHNGVIQACNRSAETERYGGGVGEPLHSVWHPSDLTAEACPVCQGGRQGESRHLELHDSQRNEWAAISLQPVRHEEQLQGFIYIQEDVTARKLASAAQHASDARLRTILDSAADGVFVAEPKGWFTYVNHQAAQMVGCSKDNLLKKNVTDLMPEEEKENARTLFRMVVKSGEARMETQMLRCDGDYLPIEVNAVRLPDGNVYAACRDITERKSYEAQLEHQANHDPLTGLANRTLLNDRMEQALVFAARAKRLVAVMLFDLDRFKLVNDSMGHDIGDALLRDIADRLANSVRPGDTVARLGGDEFMVVMSDMAAEGDAVVMARKLLSLVEAPVKVGMRELVVTASLGVALYPRDGDKASTLIKNADIAMYRAKDDGSNHFRFYSPEMNARLLERLDLEVSLRRALERDELVLHYQPQVSVADGKVFGVEALIRWHHPEMGMIPPAKFIPLAEETGLIVQVGEWVIETACAQLRDWDVKGHSRLNVAVNVSARQFQQEDLASLVTKALQRHSLQAERLELEITESVLMDAPEQAVDTLRKLKSTGVKIALDDFGTGYSSLNYLKQFPIDKLKIDQSFVRDVPADEDDASIALSIIGLAHNLKRSVIAEGVETQEQLNFLRDNDCDAIQGFLFAGPMEADAFSTWLDRESPQQKSL